MSLLIDNLYCSREDQFGRKSYWYWYYNSESSFTNLVGDRLLYVQRHMFWKLSCPKFRFIFFFCTEPQSLEILTHESDLCLKVTWGWEYICLPGCSLQVFWWRKKYSPPSVFFKGFIWTCYLKDQVLSVLGDTLMLLGMLSLYLQFTEFCYPCVNNLMGVL